ncbi:MAG: GAF domain-containing protein [Acidobacteriota bacterium]
MNRVNDQTTKGRDVGSAAGRLSHASMSGSELLDQLRATLDRAAELVRVIEEDLGGVEGGGALLQSDAERTRDLEARLSAAEADVKELAARLVDSEHQAGRLMNLYVATYQLHATLHPAEVQQTIAEIAINLLGAERFVLLLKEEENPDHCEVALGESLEEDEVYEGGRYEGGDPMVDEALEDGVLRLGPYDGSKALAAVPLRVHDAVVGALVILKLFDHKPMLRGEDRDLLDLLSAHAASALFAARLYAAKDRKLRSLESLVKLARGEE